MAITNYLGLSTTKPALDGQNITENVWPAYARVGFDISTWTNPIGTTTYVSTATIAFPTVDSVVNAYFDVPYFVLYDSGGAFVCAGSVNPLVTLTRGVALNFSAGNIIIDTSKTVYIPDTSSLAFPQVLTPAFAPTYEPAALGEPILYMLNMRS